jgi:hypothetical protein
MTGNGIPSTRYRGNMCGDTKCIIMMNKNKINADENEHRQRNGA